MLRRIHRKRDQAVSQRTSQNSLIRAMVRRRGKPGRGSTYLIVRMMFPFVSMATLGRHCMVIYVMYGIWPDRGALMGINYYEVYMFLVLCIQHCPRACLP
jgi:hypothetical protein